MQRNLTTICSIGFLLFIIGFMGMTLMISHAALDFWKQKLMIIVELRDDIEENTLNTLQTQLENAAYVVPSSLDIITKEEAAEQMKIEFGEDYFSEDLPNPLHHVYTFNVTKAFSDTLSLEGIKRELKLSEAVFEVFYEKDLSQNISKNISNLLWYIVAFGILFIFVAIFIVKTNVNLFLQQAKANITEPEEDWRLPTMNELLVRGIKNAIWSATLAVAALIAMSYWVANTFVEINTYIHSEQVVMMLCSLFAVSAIIYLVSTWWAAKQSNN